MFLARVSLAALLCLAAAPVLAAPAPATAPAAAPTVPAGPSATQISLYKSVMEANGTSRNVRQTIQSAKREILSNLLTEQNKTALSPQDQARFDKLADPALKALADSAIGHIAQGQSAGFTEAELKTLVAANATPAAKHFLLVRFDGAEGDAAIIQTYMVDSVILMTKALNGDKTALPALHPGDADKSIDPATLALATKLIAVEGMGDLIRHFVTTGHLPLVLGEVKRRVDFASIPPETLAQTAKIVEKDLAERIVALNARKLAKGMSAEELTALIAAFDIPAQKKLTAVRLGDGGSIDMTIESELRATTQKIVADFKAGK